MYDFISPIAPPSRLTGVERAVYTRYQVFRQNHVPVRLISLQFNQFLWVNAQREGVAAADLLNLYDAICHIDYTRTQSPPDVRPVGYDAVQQAGELTRYFRAGRLLRKVRTSGQGNLISVYDYNQDRESLSVTFYRPEGYAAMQQWFGPTGRTRTVYFDQAGRVCLTVSDDQAHASRSLVVTDWASGQTRMFATEAALAGAFLDQVARRQGQPTFITDHTADLLPALNAMTVPVRKFAFIHAAVKVKNAQVAGYYRPLAATLDDWAGVIVSTKAQAADLLALWPQTRVLQASVSVVPQAGLTAPVPAFEARHARQLVMLARVDPAKDIAAAVAILQAVRVNLPTTTLEIWGSPNVPAFATYRAQLDMEIAARGLTEVVHFRGYTARPELVLDHARLLLVTSRSEGTGLVINEALARGVPVVSYDFKYGPRAFIQDGKNGYLVAAGDTARAARCCVQLLTNARDWQLRATAARKLAKRFDMVHNWQQWQRVLTAMQEAEK